MPSRTCHGFRDRLPTLRSGTIHLGGSAATRTRTALRLRQDSNLLVSPFTHASIWSARWDSNPQIVRF